MLDAYANLIFSLFYQIIMFYKDCGSILKVHVLYTYCLKQPRRHPLGLHRQTTSPTPTVLPSFNNFTERGF